MSHTKRTCHKCGWRDIQPNMIRRTIRQEWASSTTGLHGRTILGSFLGEKKSANEVKKYFFYPSKRKYHRVKTVFECPSCYGSAASRLSNSAQNITDIFSFILKASVVLLVLWVFVAAITESNKKRTNESAEPAQGADSEEQTGSTPQVFGDVLENTVADPVTPSLNASLSSDAAVKDPVGDSGPVEPATESSDPQAGTASPATLARIPSISRYYPAGAKKNGEEGSAVVRTCVDAKGKILGSPTVVTSSLIQSLDEGAIRLAKAVKYQPGKVDGRPLDESCVSFKVTFELDS